MIYLGVKRQLEFAEINKKTSKEIREIVLAKPPKNNNLNSDISNIISTPTMKNNLRIPTCLLII